MSDLGTPKTYCFRDTANMIIFQSLREFFQGYNRHNGTKPLSPYATSTYDTVWTIALTLRKSMENWRQNISGGGNYRLESFSYENGDDMRNMFFSTMQNLGFLGISVCSLIYYDCRFRT